MRIKQVKMGLINELSPERQAKELDKYRDYNTGYDWYEFTISEFIESAKNCGIEISEKNVFFSGFWSQGDGASFKGRVDIQKYLEVQDPDGKRFPSMKLRAKKEDLTVVITTRGNYCHSNTMCLDRASEPHIIHGEPEDSEYSEMELTMLMMTEDSEATTIKIWDSLQDEVLEFCKELADKLYKQLEDEYTDLTSDESVKEALLNNEVEFEIEEV